MTLHQIEVQARGVEIKRLKKQLREYEVRCTTLVCPDLPLTTPSRSRDHLHRHRGQHALNRISTANASSRRCLTSASATRKRAKGGMRRRALSVAKHAESSTYGARILNNYPCAHIVSDA